MALVDLFLKPLNYGSRMRESSKQKNNIVCPLWYIRDKIQRSKMWLTRVDTVSFLELV